MTTTIHFNAEYQKVNAFKSGAMSEKYDFLNGCISATYNYFAEVGTSGRSSDSIRL